MGVKGFAPLSRRLVRRDGFRGGRPKAQGRPNTLAARRQPPRAARIVTLVNRNDPAVNNEAAKQVSDLWSRHKPSGVEYVEMTDLPTLHDIVDPGQPHGCPELVYPRFLRALGLESS